VGKKAALAALVVLVACAAPPRSTPPPEPSSSWVVAYEEDFESLQIEAPPWRPDPHAEDGEYADEGPYYTRRGIHAPPAFRATVQFGKSRWLTCESSTRTAGRPFSDLFSVVRDPGGSPGSVLRVRSVDHTDAIVVRPTAPLPERYRVSLKVGFPSFGDGLPGKNGYDGGETAEPWSDKDATEQNGFYWLTILDHVPGPHNNTWIHHHRKVVIDSDNHDPPWMEIHDGQRFVPSGEHPIMMFALDGEGPDHDRIGKPFISWSAGTWQPSGAIRAVDAYLPGRWYRATIERNGPTFTLEVAGTFRFGGARVYRATIDADARHVFHARGFPDWFMFGDPHTNYYEGEVFYDDVRLEVPR
jgi:hypothetical protein